MRKIVWFLLLLALVVAAVLLWFEFSGRTRSTFKRSERNFAFADTGRISGVMIIHEQDTILLEEVSRAWMVNGRHRARKSRIETLFTVIHRLDISAPVEKARKDSIYHVLNHSGKHVYLQDDQRVLRHYLVLYEEEGRGRTVMKLHKAKQAFYMEIPGYPVKNLSFFFNLDEDFWRDPVIFDFLPSEIEQVTLIYRDEPSFSFRVVHKYGNKPGVENPLGDEDFQKIDTTAIMRYLSYFIRVEYVSSADPGDLGYNLIKMEQTPYIRIAVGLHDGRSYEAGLYRIPGDTSAEQDKLNWELNYFYLKFERSPEIYKVAFVEFDPILKKREYFIELR